MGKERRQKERGQIAKDYAKKKCIWARMLPYHAMGSVSKQRESLAVVLDRVTAQTTCFFSLGMA